MTDERELLELAAKAAGLEYHWVKVEGGQLMQASEPGSRSEESWNPITDDGDRYRLAKKLDMRIHFAPGYVTYLNPYGKCGVLRWPEDAADDAYAIVIAAAEIGRSMP